MTKSKLSDSVEKDVNHRQLVESLQEERSAVWSMYCRIAEQKPFSNASTVRPILSKFSQVLIDYVSLGHFGIYEQLLSEKQHQASVISYAERIYPEFTKTTSSAVLFSDQYDDGRRNFKIDHLAEDLSRLGERLAERMELEDRLCSMLLA